MKPTKRTLVIVAIAVISVALGAAVCVLHKKCANSLQPAQQDGGQAATKGAVQAQPQGQPAEEPMKTQTRNDVLQQEEKPPEAHFPRTVVRAYENMYRLPSVDRVNRLSRTRNRQLRLTPAQKSNIKELNESIRRKVKAAVDENRAAQARLREEGKAQDADGKMDRQAAQELRNRLAALQARQKQIRADLDRQYRDMAKDVLTDKQMEFLDDDSDLQQPPPPDRHPSGGGGTATPVQ